jgi:hypothetical protein
VCTHIWTILKSKTAALIDAHLLTHLVTRHRSQGPNHFLDAVYGDIRLSDEKARRPGLLGQSRARFSRPVGGLPEFKGRNQPTSQDSRQFQLGFKFIF